MTDLQGITVKFGGDLSALASSVVGASAPVAGFGLAVVGAAALSVKAAGDWQASITALHTGAGELSSNLASDSASMLKMAVDTGTATSQLAAGMFMINSSGQKGSQALLTLRDAAEAAKVGNADLGVVAKGVTAIMTDYASANVTAAQAANSLVATVSDGETTMQDLSASLDRKSVV